MRHEHQQVLVGLRRVVGRLGLRWIEEIGQCGPQIVAGAVFLDDGRWYGPDSQQDPWPRYVASGIAQLESFLAAQP